MIKHITTILFAINLICIQCIQGQEMKPVSPNASPEAKALLNFLYDISGKYTLTGQHNFPNIKGRNTKFAASYIGKTPVVYSTDMGFAKDGDTDSHLARPDIVKQAIELNKQGYIITICWHAVPPTADEPVTFRPMRKYAPDSLSSVQGKLLDNQFKDLLTPGTRLYKHWCAQVDTIAFYLKQLQAAHVPILWRPYHEMNGDWFWWGGRTGKYSTIALYHQLFNRLVKVHKLNNLIWLWSIDRPVKPGMEFSKYSPGSNFLDILSLDVYGNDFKKVYYDSLLVLSKGKPIALAEVGNPPSPEILNSQPKWVLYSVWTGMVRNTLKKDYNRLIKETNVLFLEDSAYRILITPYRLASGLEPLPVYVKKKGNNADFTGTWILDEEKSNFNNIGAGSQPVKIEVVQQNQEIRLKKTNIVEFADDIVTEEVLPFNGTEVKSEFRNFPRIATAKWIAGTDTLAISSRVTFNNNGKTTDMITDESWSLQPDNNELVIHVNSKSPWGIRKFDLLYNRH